MNYKFLTGAMIAGLAFSSAASFAEDNGDHHVNGKHHANYMMKVDTNGDGFVSKSEFMAHHEAHFVKVDSDNDGRLSADEMVEAKAKMKAHKNGKTKVRTNVEIDGSVE